MQCQGSLAGAPVLLSPGSEFQAGGENPVSSAPEESAATVKSKPKAKKGTRKRKRRGGKRKARRASQGLSAGGKGGRR